MTTNITPKGILLLFWIVLSSLTARTQPLSAGQIDSLVTSVMKTFDVPGIAVAVIKDGQVVHSKGYGVRSLQTGLPVDEHTLFGIASNTKAFTTGALALLVDRGKINWDDRVTQYLPEFKMYDDYVTREFTIRDLLTHRSGLGLGAGDLMLWPAPNHFTKNDILHNLRYLKPVSSFRSKYDYDNLLYVVAGEIIATVSGQSWEEFIDHEVLAPLGMTESASSYSRLKDPVNVIDPHASAGGKAQVISRDYSEVTNAAGGIYSSIYDLSKWVMMHLNQGQIAGDTLKTFLSRRVHDELWTAQTPMPVKGYNPYNTQKASYALGWRLHDIQGHRQVSHTGGLAGMVTQITLLPDIQLGIVVLTNQQSESAYMAISNTIKDRYLGIIGADRIRELQERKGASQTAANQYVRQVDKDIQARIKRGWRAQDMIRYEGTYTDAWFGDITISRREGKLWFDSQQSPRLTGILYPYKDHTLVVKWKDRFMGADAFVIFDMNTAGKGQHIQMKAVSPLTDFSFDFQDLDFHKK